MKRVLVIDNYDSFTYNLVQYLGELGADLTVWRNDAFSLEEIGTLNPDAIVISPGPCTPTEAGHSVAVIERYKGEYPMLGVCLGHQSMGQAFGAKVVRAKIPMHGKTSVIEHRGEDVFSGLPEALTVTRYHSLVVEDLPDTLIPTAWVTETDGTRTLMALRHRDLPIYGVQFHPESIASEGGLTMLANFLALTDSPDPS
ncbi:anthranilate synthase component II [Deinococcus peraridilitoris]|uniref:Glutamine amidotransferase of anthranilate synthase or aminodeoxychorismate synthase n=1 Tax=Deinococcus peraridilitoris (strain DSM 19664 / LMG 22246 / CIP 109416 / KR-200) TaxID=937777 RepID=K9ZYY8_DEIPD|nr:aminodeoxychorismate/anthranilate synthase component II [Deinococcus peraridilitoris]AFZ65975.1 glutamine amidotransferase of anthranilate synthase or aminodeoxychorismate synthase [Deinococcus peraridilitoris DSM 19664]